MREALMKEKGRLIEELMKVNPTYQAPADFVKSKPVKRIYLPKQTNPLYNYIGLIIGPRGNTQKQMEQDTGCKISIRGKGSAKEGSKSKAKNADDDDELHVHISGEDEASVEKATKIIEELLRPQDDAVNEHKQKQLRELALINGTLREDEYCPVCGEKGHRQFECPHRARSFKAAGVKCSICGDLSHPTRDCPLKQEGPTNQVTLDTEYDSFMAELTDGPSKGAKTASDASSSSSAGSSKPAGKAGGPIYVAPIVDLVAPRKNQTIIHVTTVMTGLTPPVFSSSSAAMPADGSATVTAPTSTAYPSYPGYPSAQPVTTPTAASMAALSMASVGASWQGNYAAPGAYGAPPAYGAYPGAYGQPPNPYPSAPYGAPQYGAVPPPGGAPAAPAVPPPPPANSVPPPPSTGNQFHYVYPTK
jgi:splicing factor 1